MSAQLTRDYRIVRLLGKGGMGEVYLAEQLRVGRRRVALKVLNRACSEKPEIVRRFENEASSAGRINHRNVVTVYESRVTDDGQMYVAMEYVEGKSLGQLLKEQEVLPLEQALEITRQVCAGLAAAHRLGIVHRDIKPDNIMIAEEDGRQIAKVLDFGIARLSENEAQGKTRAGVIMGTPAYMSPEQAMGKTAEQIDARSDIYALGMVVYQMLAGRPAFDGKTPMEVFRKQISERPLPPGYWRPEMAIPAAVEAVLLKALEKRREARQQTVGEFLRELEEAAGSGAQGAVLAPVTQRDIPTVRVGSRGGETATAPLSSEITASPERRVTKESRLPQMAETKEERRVTASPKVATRATSQPASVAPEQRRTQARRPGRSGRALLIGGLFLGLLLAGIYMVKQKVSRGDNAPLTHRVMEFRVRREQPTADLDTLDADNVMHVGEYFDFEMKVIDPGAIYLFEEPGGEAHASWQWLNPTQDGPAQQLPVGEWSRFPQYHLLEAGYQPGVKKYLIVYVPNDPNDPNGLRWPPAARLQPLSGTASNGRVQLPADVAASISESLTKGALELKAQGDRKDRKVTFGLEPAGDKQPAFYEVVLKIR